MAIYNTSSDAANTAIRSFLTKVGEYYLEETFNTGSKKGKEIWNNIKANVFNNKCGYCGEHSSNLQIEHLIMFNKDQCGLHHPGNIIPCCAECNRRRKDANEYLNWENHLKQICTERNEVHKFAERKAIILEHMQSGIYKYPDLTNEEQKAISIIANSLYENVKTEHEKGLDLYKELQKAFITK